LPAVYFYGVDKPLLGLLFCILSGIIDYIDGDLARKTTGETKLGEYLDTSLDWLWYLLLIGGVAYGVDKMVVGCLCVIFTAFGNYLDTRHRSLYLGSFPFSPIIFILVCSLFSRMVICLYLMTFFALLRCILLLSSSISYFGSRD